MRLPAICAIAAVLVLAGGCGGGGGNKASSGGGNTVPVSMQGLRFHPTAVSVKTGQTVVWTNDDSVDHNVTATSGGTFHSLAFGHGGTYRFVAKRAGTVKYVCTLHPGMVGSIKVTSG
jgi:plastocyanin